MRGCTWENKINSFLIKGSKNRLQMGIKVKSGSWRNMPHAHDWSEQTFEIEFLKMSSLHKIPYPDKRNITIHHIHL